MSGFANQIIGGAEVLARSGIRSDNYVTGVSGWRIARNGDAEFSNAQIRGAVIIGSVAGQEETIGGPVPAEVAAYYTAGITGITKTAPETVVAMIEQTPDGQGNYAYRAVVVDSSTPKLTSIVFGAVDTAAVVTEAGRFVVDPGATLGGGRYELFTERAITILTDPASGTTVFATRHPSDAFDVLSINVGGTIGWGDGSGLTDSYLARLSALAMEFGGALQIHGYGSLTDTLFNVLQDGEGNGRFFVRANGQLRWSDGSASSDTTLERASAGVLTVNGVSMLPNSTPGNFTPAGTQNINTTGYTSVTGVSQAFTKNYGSSVSAIEIDLRADGFTSAVDNVTLGVLINGTDTQVDVFRFNAINDHRKFGGLAKVTGLAAGSYTAVARIKVGAGTTTFTTGASVSGWSIGVREVKA